MINDLKPYPAMKDSGVPWLGEVPVHWEVRKVREVAHVINGFPFDAGRFSQSTGYPLIRIRDLNKARTATRYDGQFVVSARVNPGDVLIGMDGDFNVGTWRGAEPALLNQRMCCIRSTEQATERLLAYLLSRPLKQINDVTWSTTVKHLASGQVERIQFGLPPLPEQAAIVHFLDHADRKIRRYIRAKQKLIKLLEEQKQAIIHRAVTRGLDPDVRLKPSCVEWLGDVPEHWYIVALKHVLKRLIDCEHKTAPAIDHSDFRVVRTTAVRNGNLRWSGTYCTTAEAFQAWTQRAIPEPGDVIFTREAPAGEACLVPEGVDICLGQRTVLIKLRRDQYDGQFLVHMIYAGPPRMRIQLASQGSTVGHFNMDDIGWMKVLAPPLQEQQRIVEAIKKGTVELARTIEKANREIDLLQEYRTRLIADVVTGKLDVREAAAGLLEEEPVADEVLSEPYDQDDAEDSLDDESFPSEEE